MSISQWESMTEGNRGAFLSIYESHYQALFSYGFTLTASRDQTKDFIQELFLEIWNKHASVNKDVINVRAYLFTWLRRMIFKENRRLKNEHCTDEMTDTLSQNVLPYEDLLIAFQQSEEKKNELAAALKKLTKKQLEIIRLRFFENLSYEEIAIQTSLTQRTVYNLVYEAIRHLRVCLRLLLFYI